MPIALITGSAGLIGSEAAEYFAALGLDVVGIDNDMRAEFFGTEASTLWNRKRLENELRNYTHHDADIRDESAIDKIFSRYGKEIVLIIHAAAQPSHDWAAGNPFTDFTINANGTLVLLESTRKHCIEAPFIFLSTNKVYGDTPNRLPLVECETRYEIEEGHRYYGGIDETMSIDRSKHSLFGASKVAADVLTQEYGRYFGMKTGVFRGGCLTGPRHSGTALHGFLAYLVKCAVTGRPYTVFGYKGKQVRDNIHSHDLVTAFDHFFKDPGSGEVYNMGGGRFSNCSMLEAIEITRKVTGSELQHTYSDTNRVGDHIWWISDVGSFKERYPGWNFKYDVKGIIREIFELNVEEWKKLKP